MASEILGLFASPELYQQQRDLGMQQQAAALAQMDPYENVRYGAIRAGQQAGAGIANLFGAEDPQLRIITARQNVMRNVDPADPQSIAAAAEALMQAGDQQGALTLADYARKAQSEAALAAQRLREGKAAATPKELQIAAARAEARGLTPNTPEYNKFIDSALAGKPEGKVREQQIAYDLALEAGEEGTDAFNKEYRKNLKELSSKESQQKLGEFERVLNTRYPDTPENATKRAELMDQFLASEITGRKTGKGTDIKLTLPGQGKEGAKDIPAFRDKVIGTIDPFRKTVTAADSAISNISDSIKTSNFASFRAAQTQFARAISGAGDLSQKELKAAGADPSLIGGTADYLSTLFTSTPTADTQKKLLSTLRAIRTVAAKKAKEELSNQKKIATRAGYTEDDTSLIFNFPEFETKAAPNTGNKTTTRTLKSGKVVTITED